MDEPAREDVQTAAVEPAVLWRLHNVVEAARELPADHQSPQLRDALAALVPYYGRGYPAAGTSLTP